VVKERQVRKKKEKIRRDGGGEERKERKGNCMHQIKPSAAQGVGLLIPF
jgi:hypothetical protein